jgi:hypothetical protein
MAKALEISAAKRIFHLNDLGHGFSIEMRQFSEA